ncbi:hypothetical protein KCU60_g11, partial [Aureobasidium melanogenum]
LTSAGGDWIIVYAGLSLENLPLLPYLRWFFRFQDTIGHHVSKCLRSISKRCKSYNSRETLHKDFCVPRSMLQLCAIKMHNSHRKQDGIH